MPIEGIPAVQSSLDALVLRVQTAARKTVMDGALLIEASAKRNASGRPGPNVITGTLRRSIHPSTSQPIRTGPNRWGVEVAPHTVYGRRIELGFHGADSLGRIYNQPAFPYFTPGVRSSRAGIYAAAVRNFARAVGR